MRSKVRESNPARARIASKLAEAALPSAITSFQAFSPAMSWTETIRLRLLQRDEREQAHAEMIEQYRRLAQQTVTLKERNAALLKASHSTRSSAGVSNSSAAAAGSSKE